MDDEALLRYSRQIMLPEIDAAGQQALADASVLLIGAGGLGSPAALYLGAAGVGRLVIADADHVELSNLQRQIAHGTPDLGRPKVESARDAIHRLNPTVEVTPLPQRLEGDALDEAVAGVDLVLDGSDNFATRFAVNAACIRRRRPLVTAAVIRWEVQVAVFRGDRGEGPCYRCLFPETEDQRETCSETGVAAPLPGVAGSLQALEALKLITGAGEPLQGRLLIMDALSMRVRILHVPADPECPVCSGRR